MILGASAAPQPLVILALEGGRLVALDAMTGQPVWEVAGPVEAGSLRHLGVRGGTLIATTTVPFPGYVAAYDVNTGSQRWSVASQNGSATLAPIAISFDDSTAFVAFTNGVIGAYGLASGQEMWFRRPPSGAFSGTAAISHDTLFIAGSEGAYAIAK